MRSKFAGGDPEYIRTMQYGTTDKLAARQRLHLEYSTAPVRWFEWMTAEISWHPGTVVEVGCGPGNLWEEGRPPIDGALVLTDLSEGMVSTAVDRARASGYRVVGQVAPAEALPIADRRSGGGSRHLESHAVPRPSSARWGGRARSDRRRRRPGHRGDQRRAAHEVELRRFADELRTTDSQHVVDYLTSYPPGEDATPEQHGEISEMVEAEFAAGDGVFTITKDVGLFFCRGPRRG